MEMRVQVLHSGVVIGWGLSMVWKWFNKVWLK